MADNVSSIDVTFHLGGRYKAWDALHRVKMCLSINKTPPNSIFDEIMYVTPLIVIKNEKAVFIVATTIQGQDVNMFVFK